jgi:hypothetical protein
MSTIPNFKPSARDARATVVALLEMKLSAKSVGQLSLLQWLHFVLLDLFLGLVHWNNAINKHRNLFIVQYSFDMIQYLDFMQEFGHDATQTIKAYNQYRQERVNLWPRVAFFLVLLMAVCVGVFASSSDRSRSFVRQYRCATCCQIQQQHHHHSWATH